MKYIGKIGEYLVLSELLKLDMEAYQAIKSNQEHYDITVVLNNKNVARLQVKATELNDKSTNNAISNLDKEYDFLVIVVVEDDNRFLILSKSEVIAEKGNNVKLSTTRKDGSGFKIKENLECYENCWDKIKKYTEAL